MLFDMEVCRSCATLSSGILQSMKLVIACCDMSGMELIALLRGNYLFIVQQGIKVHRVKYWYSF